MRQVVPLCSQLGAVLLLVLTALVLVWITKISRIQGCQSMRFPWDFMSSHFWLLILLDTPWYTRQDTRDIPVTRSSCPWCSWVSDLVNGRSTIQTSKILNTSVTSVLKQQLKTRHHCSHCSQVTFIATWQCGFQWLLAAWDMDPRSLCFVRNKNHPSKSWSYGLLHMQGRFPCVPNGRMGHIQNIQYGPTVGITRRLEDDGIFMIIYARFESFRSIFQCAAKPICSLPCLM